MKKVKVIIASVLVCLMAFSTLLPHSVRAAGAIDVDRDVTLTIQHTYEGTPIAYAEFELYRVADVDPNRVGAFILNETFSAYPVNLDGLDQAGWASLAMTLKGYVQRDGLRPHDYGATDENGELTFPHVQNVMKPGLFLVIGGSAEIGSSAYSASPFMVALPDLSEDDEWIYSVTAQTKTAEMPALTDVRVIKVWDDEGFENRRPSEITVQLLCDGRVEDSAVLNEANSWRHAWENLEKGHEWTVVEIEPENYFVSVEQQGVTFVITNSYNSPNVLSDPPISKLITGDTPSQAQTFTFVLAAQDPSFPMPEGSADGIKRATVVGSGVTEFGEIAFNAAGTYKYTAYELQENVNGYTFDRTVYEVTYVVTEENGRMQVERTIEYADGGKVDNIVFTNHYKKPGNIPQTGMLFWPIFLLVDAGILFIVLGVLQRRRRSFDNEK